MSFFEKLPDLLYVSSIKKSGFGDYTRVKNIFRRYKLRDDVKKYAFQFYKYQVPEGWTPEQVANSVYSDPDLYWVVLIINDIVDVRTNWPLDSEALENYVYSTYDNPDGVHHYETYQRKDADGNVVMKQGLIVNPGWQHEYVYSQEPLVKKTLNFEVDAYSVTNFEWEEYQNDKKRIIELLHPDYVGAIVADYERVTSYESNSDLEDDTTKKTAIDLVRKYY